jgi:hypothetical protein
MTQIARIEIQVHPRYQRNPRSNGGWRKGWLVRERNQDMKRCTLNPVVSAMAGLSAAFLGTAALETSADTWPTILVVIGAYVAASGIRSLRC